jgi:aminoglycoside N3'-acetyltransferase
MHTRYTLAVHLRRLGVAPGDTLFIHSSYRSIGAVEGEVGAVVGALEDAVGSEGLLLMPSFNLKVKGGEARAAIWNPVTSPSTVGWLTEYFRTMSGTVRSDHYSHSVAARGKDAATFVGEHRSPEGMESPWDRNPWGRTYGTRSPMMKAYQQPASKVLMMGVDFLSSTYCHFVETMFWAWNKSLTPDAQYQFINSEVAGAWWDGQGHLSRGMVGDADSRLFGIRDFVDNLLDAVKIEPDRFLRKPVE